MEKDLMEKRTLKYTFKTFNKLNNSITSRSNMTSQSSGEIGNVETRTTEALLLKTRLIKLP